MVKGLCSLSSHYTEGLAIEGEHEVKGGKEGAGMLRYIEPHQNAVLPASGITDTRTLTNHEPIQFTDTLIDANFLSDLE